MNQTDQSPRLALTDGGKSTTASAATTRFGTRLMRHIGLGATLLMLASCAHQASQNDAKAQDTTTGANTSNEVRKSPNDERLYRYLELPNKMRVLLVSDASTEKAAAALSVYRGSFHEPEERPGLAHFLEHMLFIQTETYPEIDGFQHHVSGNGGSSNAYTALDHTNYFFDIRPEAFDEALDRFAHFFIDPVLSPEYSAREKNAVHSEYQLQLKDDGWRGYMVSKQVLNPEHPGSRFTIGSLDTLDGEIHEDLLHFFETQYSADQMGLVVLSNQSLDELEAKIAQLFGRIENKNLGPDYPNVPMYTAEQIPARVAIQAQKEGTSVSYNFPLPNTRQHYRKKPEIYFSNLIGHEGSGSLYQLLNSKGWVESLGASVGELDRNNSILTISMELSESGAGNIDAITTALFQYIDLLKNTKPAAWLYEEQATVAEIGFRFQENSNPMGFVYQMAPRINEYPPADLLVAPYLMEEFDAKLINEYLSYIRPDNLLQQIVSADVEGDQIEPWFKVPYSLKKGPIPNAPLAEQPLSLPAPNPYLPEDLDLKTADENGIFLAVDKPGMQIWLDTDVEFRTPRANLYLELAVRDGLVSPTERALAQLYKAIVTDALSEQTYPAYLAGLGYSLGVGDSGFEVTVGGYEDQQGVLLETVLDALLNTQIDGDKFEKFKSSLLRDWRNAKKDKPINQAFTALSDVLRSGRWPREMLAETLAPLDVEQLRAWRKNRLTGFAIQGLLHGNSTTADAQAISNTIAARLPISATQLHRPSVSSIDKALRLQIPVDHNDAAIVLHIQDKDESFDSRARSSLAAQILHNAYFLELRTNQQLGYIVSVSNRPIVKRGGISFIVQSPVKSAVGLVEATQNFLADFKTNWQDVDPSEFDQQKAGLINRLTQKPKNLGDRSQQYWGDLRQGYLNFDSRQQVADIVATLTQEDMANFFTRLQNSFDNQQLLIYTQGKFDETPSAGTLLKSATATWGD